MAFTAQSGSQDPGIVFDEPFGFSIKHIEVLRSHNKPPLAFPSGNWKPPVEKQEFRHIQNVTYASRPQSTRYLWRAPSAQRTEAVTVMPTTEEKHYNLHQTATLFWDPNSHRFLQVEFDCTKQNVEDTSKPKGEEPQNTWRWLRFRHKYPTQRPTISLASSNGDTMLGGGLPSRWNSTLIPSVYRCENADSSSRDCQIAGNLTFLLGLVAFCAGPNNEAIDAVNNWFPPSKGQRQWMGNSPKLQQAKDRQSRRGMVIETYYDTRRAPTAAAAQARLAIWESGSLGAIIT